MGTLPLRGGRDQQPPGRPCAALRVFRPGLGLNRCTITTGPSISRSRRACISSSVRNTSFRTFISVFPLFSGELPVCPDSRSRRVEKAGQAANPNGGRNRRPRWTRATDPLGGLEHELQRPGNESWNVAIDVDPSSMSTCTWGLRFREEPNRWTKVTEPQRARSHGPGPPDVDTSRPPRAETPPVRPGPTRSRGRAVANLGRKAEHPMAHRHPEQNVLDQVLILEYGRALVFGPAGASGRRAVRSWWPGSDRDRTGAAP